MSFMKASLVAMLAVSMASTPVLAQTAAASSSPVVTESARSGAAMDDASAMRGGFLIPLLAALAVIAGIYFAVSGGDDDRPTSP